MNANDGYPYTLMDWIEDHAPWAEKPAWHMRYWTRRVAGCARRLFRPGTLATCMRCGALAQWHYLPSGPRMDYCDRCVSRGCDGHIIDKSIRGKIISEVNADGVALIWTDYGEVEPEQYRDRRGRLQPCVEFEFDRWGWPRREE